MNKAMWKEELAITVKVHVFFSWRVATMMLHNSVVVVRGSAIRSTTRISTGCTTIVKHKFLCFKFW